MEPLAANVNSFWASLIVEELIRNGIDYFCLAPGSRCTPLTVAVADHEKATTSIHYDERGLAFHALGYGRATGQPAVVITTSGTAVPNLLPAVVEAAMERIPMLLLTADRPPELRGTGANQTIDQINIFGKYVRWFTDLPCPNTEIAPPAVLTTIGQALYQSRWPESGPVQINCMFREPLAPEPQDLSWDDYVRPVEAWLAADTPYTVYAQPGRSPNPQMRRPVAKILSETQRGLIVLGGIQRLEDQKEIAALLNVLKWPVCADITSGLRLGNRSGTVIPHADVLLRDERFVESHRPEIVLHVGGRLVSKQLATFLSQCKPSSYILVTDHSQRQDPGHEVTMRIESDFPSFCQALIGQLKDQTNPQWLASWKEKATAAGMALSKCMDQDDGLSEPAVAFLLSKHLPVNQGLFLGNSMPVRDMDIFADCKGAVLGVAANRGASGIDGTIASASGFASGLRRPVTLLMGDLAFLHDLNALNFLRSKEYPVIVVVINNNGGGIFSHLPIARYEKYLEPFFITPHDLSFQNVAQMYGIAYYRPCSCRDFVKAYNEAVESGNSAVVEVCIDRKQNISTHSQFIRRMQEAVSP